MPVVADNHYDGWTATVDGTPAEVLYANHTFRGIPVPAGNHRVELEFRPWRLAVGGWISAAGWALLGLYGLLAICRARRR